MSDQAQWSGGFAGAPAQQPAQAQPQPSAPAQSLRPFHRMELPPSVEKSMYWKPDTPRAFGLYEPTAGEISAMVKRGGDFNKEIVGYIAMVGEHKRPNCDTTTIASPWWASLPPKAQVLIVNEWLKFVEPTVDEGNFVSASRVFVTD